MNRSKIIAAASTMVLSCALLATSGQAFARDRDDRRYDRDHHRYSIDDVRGGKKHRSKRGRDHRSKHDRRGCFDCRVEKRQDRQQARIRQGLRSGELTRHEARKLRKQQRRVERLERRYAADGKFTKTERRRLVRALDRASDRIYRFKHNDLYRRSHRYGYRYDRGLPWREFSWGGWYFDLD